MTNLIPRYHLLMDKKTYLNNKKSGTFNGFYGSLSYGQTQTTIDKFLPLFQKVGEPWGWNNISKYKDLQKLNEHLQKPETKLFHLLDELKIVGYCLLTKPSAKEVQKIISKHAFSANIAEIENLGLFPSQTGKGRGLKFFEIVLSDLFKKYDYVYWSMTSTNHPGLFDFYTKKLNMKHIATTYAPDPLNSVEVPEQKQAA